MCWITLKNLNSQKIVILRNLKWTMKGTKYWMIKIQTKKSSNLTRHSKNKFNCLFNKGSGKLGVILYILMIENQ